MATHSSVLAWRTPGMGEPGGLPSMGLHRVGHDWSNLAAAATSKEPGAKTRCWQLQKQGPVHSTLHSIPPKWWANHLSHPSSPILGHTPLFTPYKEPAPSPLGSEQGNLSPVLAPPCGNRTPNEALPEFVWPLVSFYWSGKDTNPDQHHAH